MIERIAAELLRFIGMILLVLLSIVLTNMFYFAILP